MGLFDRGASNKRVVKKKSSRGRSIDQRAKTGHPATGRTGHGRTGLSRLLPSPPGSGTKSSNGGAPAPKTRSYSAEEIVAATSATPAGTDGANTADRSTANGHPDTNGDPGDGGKRFAGLRYKKDGRIGKRDDEQNLADKEIFDSEGTLWATVIFWMMTILAVLGALVLAFVLVRAAIELWPGGQDSGSGQATDTSSTGDERAAASVAEGFVESYLSLSAGEDSTDIEARLAPFVSSSTLSGQIAAQTTGEVDRQVMSTSSYQVSAVDDGRYAVSVDALTLTDSNSSDDNSDGGSSSLERNALKVYVGGSGGDFGVVAPPAAIAPPSASEDLAGALSGTESIELTDDALEDHLRGYFSAAYGASDAQASVEEFFTDGADMPIAPAEGYTYLDLDGATLYEIPAEEVEERHSAAYRVEAYVSVREESTGSTSYQTHLLEVAKEQGGEWTITNTIGG